MGLAEAIRTCLRKYAVFRGRASRSEYWWFIVFLALAGAAAGVVDRAVFGPARTTELRQDLSGNDVEMTPTLYGDGPVSAAFSLATVLPTLAAGWRRMHDTGRSGLYSVYPLIVVIGVGSFVAMSGVLSPGGTEPALNTLVGLILAVGMLVLLISPLLVLWWLTRPSQPGHNRYGPNPHEVTP